jgi:hypothetical protein
MVIFGAISATLLRLLLESNILKLGKEGISLQGQATRIMVTQRFPSARMVRYPDHVGSLSLKIPTYPEEAQILRKWVEMLKYPTFFYHPMTHDPYDHALESEFFSRAFYYRIPMWSKTWNVNYR